MAEKLLAFDLESDNSTLVNNWELVDFISNLLLNLKRMPLFVRQNLCSQNHFML